MDYERVRNVAKVMKNKAANNASQAAPASPARAVGASPRSFKFGASHSPQRTSFKVGIQGRRQREVHGR